MRRFLIYILVSLSVCSVGCESETVRPVTSSIAGSYSGYSASQVSIIGLTEIIWRGDEMIPAVLTVYLDLLDSSGSRIKSPGVFRMELFTYVPRSSLPMGRRITAWDDVNLYQYADNNQYWQDHLRAYKFDLQLNFFPQKGQTYILQATCTTPSGRHLIDTSRITYMK